MRMPAQALMQTAQSIPLPPPVGGWDTRNALADMPVQNAVIMDNWFPSTDRVTLRNGFTSHATGMSGNVDSLMPYVDLDGTQTLFAANGTSWFDVTSSGAVGAAVVSSLSNAQWQHCQMNTTGNNFLFAVNSADTARTFDGTTHAVSTITGVTLADLAWCNVHNRRLWIGEKDSLTAYYLAADAIAGTATAFHLGGIARLGGYLMGMATWTRDSGEGADDVAVFVTSEGEAILYQGTDPSADSTWGLVGVFRIGKPLGRRFYAKLGADLVLLTQDGVVPATKMFITDRVQAENVAITQQVNKAFNDAVRLGSTLFGWEPLVYPKGQQLIANQPATASKLNQFVFNTITQAPTRFTGINARCFGLLNDDVYFGGTDGVIYKYDDGANDNSANIKGDVLQAFNYFGSPGLRKVWKAVEVVFQANATPNVALDLQTDYRITSTVTPASSTISAQAQWDVAQWDVDNWGASDEIFRTWQGVAGIGHSAALRVQIDTDSVTPSWIVTNFLFQPAGML